MLQVINWELQNLNNFFEGKTGKFATVVLTAKQLLLLCAPVDFQSSLDYNPQQVVLKIFVSVCLLCISNWIFFLSLTFLQPQDLVWFLVFKYLLNKWNNLSMKFCFQFKKEREHELTFNKLYTIYQTLCQILQSSFKFI